MITADDSKSRTSGSYNPAGLRVCMVSRLFSPAGGLELYCHKIVEGLLDRGVHVTVLCEENQSKLEHPHLKFQLFAKPAKGPKWRRLEEYLSLTTHAVRHAGTFDIVHSQHHPMHSPDVVTFHNHTVSRLSEVGEAWEKLLNDCKVRFTRAYQHRDKVDKILSTSAKCLVFTSKTCRDDFYKAFSLAEKPSVISYPGASLASPSPQSAPNKTPSQTFTLLFVGKGFRKKGLDVLLKAMQVLKNSGENCQLLIAGLKERPLDTARLFKLGLKGSVHYLGFRKDMDNVYAQADSIVLPSRIEPFGMAPLQGMLRGLAPIVSAVSGVAEVLSDNHDALILKNHLDHKELAGLIAELIHDRVKLTKISENAKITAESITWDKAVDATIDAYQLVLTQKTN